MNVIDMRNRFAWPESYLTTAADQNFLALALAGEVGELCNLVKKGWRGDGYDIRKIRAEIADIRIYLELFAQHYEADGDKMLDLVWVKMEERASELGIEGIISYEEAMLKEHGPDIIRER